MRTMAALKAQDNKTAKQEEVHRLLAEIVGQMRLPESSPNVPNPSRDPATAYLRAFASPENLSRPGQPTNDPIDVMSDERRRLLMNWLMNSRANPPYQGFPAARRSDTPQGY